MKRPGYYLDDTNKLHRKLSVEFERRLKKLDVSIHQYFETGNYGSLFPFLFSCISYVWSHHDDGCVYSKTSSKTSVKK